MQTANIKILNSGFTVSNPVQGAVTVSCDLLAPFPEEVQVGRQVEDEGGGCGAWCEGAQAALLVRHLRPVAGGPRPRPHHEVRFCKMVDSQKMVISFWLFFYQVEVLWHDGAIVYG
jgi:hypothetical protein